MRLVTGLSNNNIATEPQCNFPYESSAVATHTSTISSTQTDIESVASESSKAIGKVKICKIRKRKGSHFSNRKKKKAGTSIDDWMKKKRLITDPNAKLTIQSGKTEESSASVLKSKEFRIKLNRLDPLAGHAQSVEKESVKRTTFSTVDSTSSLASKFEKGFILLERINSEPLLSDSRLENSKTTQTQPESTSAVSTCSPDTTTSSSPQNILLSDVNTEVQTENNAALNAENCDPNPDKCLRMAYDDCDTDVPSPMYSPYNGIHKNVNDKRSKSNIAANHSSLVLNESKTNDNTITPIVLRTNTDGSEIRNSTDAGEITMISLLPLGN